MELNSKRTKYVKTQKQPPEVYHKESVLRNFTKFRGKHLCKSLFFNKVLALRSATLLTKTLWHRCLFVNFAKFLHIFLQNTSRRQFLKMEKETGSDGIFALMNRVNIELEDDSDNLKMS